MPTLLDTHHVYINTDFNLIHMKMILSSHIMYVYSPHKHINTYNDLDVSYVLLYNTNN